jgi:hypothetical protein
VGFFLAWCAAAEVGIESRNFDPEDICVALNQVREIPELVNAGFEPTEENSAAKQYSSI